MTLRILCVGAFANGNLGDMYQADAIARLIAASGVDAEVVSASPSKRGAFYPVSNHHAASPGSLFDMEFVNSFDIMIVGGGGLLSARHRPLNDPGWVSNVRIPMIALSLGAAVDASNTQLISSQNAIPFRCGMTTRERPLAI